ncbi:MAG: metallophosphoesterase [Trueperaceae bacterium]|nr:metallophosphoesterase [Trueperaceae bacterium]
MIKLVAIGDVHARFEVLWRALRATGAATAAYEPSDAVIEGRIEVVCTGDLVHPKNAAAYGALVGVTRFDPGDQEHLRRAARVQVRELRRVRRFVDAAQGHVTITLGNHDDAVVPPRRALGSGRMPHAEFDPERGGEALPDDLVAWFASFPRAWSRDGVQVAHAGPTPGMQTFDDFFYGDPAVKTWWYATPDLVRQTGHRFGVYGHTVMRDGIHLDAAAGVAMIDALDRGEVLEAMLDADRLDVRVTTV